MTLDGTEPTDGRQPATYKVRLAVRRMHLIMRISIAKHWTPSARVHVREVAARLPTIVLLEELYSRMTIPSTAVLADALQDPRTTKRGKRAEAHPLAIDLAELVTKFTERAAAMRSGSSDQQA